jgi:hypothetical protein
LYVAIHFKALKMKTTVSSFQGDIFSSDQKYMTVYSFTSYKNNITNLSSLNFIQYNPFLNAWADAEHIFHSHSIFTRLTRIRIKISDLHNNISIPLLYVISSSCNLCRLRRTYEPVRTVSKKGKESRVWGRGGGEDLIWTSDVVIIKHTAHISPVRFRGEVGGVGKHVSSWRQEFVKMYAAVFFDDSICQIKRDREGKIKRMKK